MLGGGCQKQNNSNNPPVKYSIPFNPSYKLEDLCDTEIYEKEIVLNVYLEPSEKLWDYHEYKDEIFKYVKEFFKEQKISCNVVYSKEEFKGFNAPNMFGLEIWDSGEKMADRYSELITRIKTPGVNSELRSMKGWAVTRENIALLNRWEDWDEDMLRKEIESQLKESHPYNKKMTKKEYLFKVNAANICHELLHCMTLFHPKDFNYALVKDNKEGIPNIMSYGNPNFKKGHFLGYQTNELQKKLIHSFVSGNNTYDAYQNSFRDLTFFMREIGLANKLKNKN